MDFAKLKPKLLVLVGPTASGKSDLAVKLAKKFSGEIISADSRQVYRGMDIGTGKITKKEMYGIPHHLLDVSSPKRQFTVSHYQKLGRTAIKKILREKKLPIIVGGTGLYVDALIYNQLLPQVKPDLKLRTKLEKQSAPELFEQLIKLDPVRAENIDRHNKRRLVRALEIVIGTGKPVPTVTLDPMYDVLNIGIKFTDSELKKRINSRLKKRLQKGMIKEVKNLHKNGVSWKRLDDLGLEYRWISRHLQGIISKKEMIEILEKEIWHYAKRQMTWFKRNKSIIWINKKDQAFALVKKFLN